MAISSPPAELMTDSKTHPLLHQDVPPSCVRILEREKGYKSGIQDRGPGETVQAALGKEWLGEDLPRCDQRCRAGPTAHGSSLCSQRTSDKVLVRLEVLLPLNRQEHRGPEGQYLPRSNGKFWSRTQDPWLRSQGIWPGQWRVVGGDLGGEGPWEWLTQCQGCNNH